MVALGDGECLDANEVWRGMLEEASLKEFLKLMSFFRRILEAD
jgi:hypothetical protein